MSSPTPSSPGQEARELLKSFYGDYPVFRHFKPLAIGIDKQLLERNTGVDRKLLRLALGIHTHTSRYLKSMEKATQRFNLDTSPAGEVPEEHRQYAADTLRERLRKEAERRKAEKEEREQKEAQAAERQHAEKLNQLMQKFAK